MQNLKRVEDTSSDGSINVKQSKKCSAVTPTREAAYTDQRIEPMLAQTGLMGCYCFDTIVKAGKLLDDTIKNTQFTDINPKDTN